MPLSLNTREVGAVTIVRCGGRIVTGETEFLHGHVSELLLDRRNIVLNLGETVFIDSSGLGMLVRLLTGTRAARGDLKLCQIPEAIHRVMTMTKIITLFETCESEEKAVQAFYKRHTATEKPSQLGRAVLCVHPSADVLAYLRGLLGQAGYNVLTSNNVRDALILLRVTRPHLVIAGPNVKAAPGAEQDFRAACASSRVLELGDEFSTLEASQAASGLLNEIRALENPLKST